MIDRFKSILFTSFFTLSLLFPSYSVRANVWQDASKVIKENVTYDGSVVGEIKLPNWDQISFDDFPGTIQGGFIPDDYNSLVGYDLSRVWAAGDLLSSFMKLGDFQEAFSIQDFSAEDILNITGFDPDNISLESFPLVGDQTLEELVNAIPDLGSLQISDIEPVADLLFSEGLDFDGLTLDSVIDFNPNIADLKLEGIDLSGYSIEDIPGLEDVQLEDFARWENAYIDEIPLLSKVPLSKMPIGLSNATMPVMRIDAVWSGAEASRLDSVSGSYEEGFSVSCDQECPYIELDDLEGSGADIRFLTEGKQWISGRDPDSANFCPDRPWGVNGGHGVLGNLNCGKEPTGRHPFGKVFKMAVWDTDETTDTVETAIFFRFCYKTLFVDLGCTPYFIGAVPFFTFSRDDWIFLGI